MSMGAHERAADLVSGAARWCRLGLGALALIAALAAAASAMAAADLRATLQPPDQLAGRVDEPKSLQERSTAGSGPVPLPPIAEVPELNALVFDALRANPEIQAMRREQLAARSRISPAGALDDPMLEAGFVNVPTDNFKLDREEMTMKMVGIVQRLPYPGKRTLREEVAAKEAEAVAHNYWETAARVVRDVKVAYFDLALARETRLAVDQNRMVLERFLRTAESRYKVGQSGLADVLKAQTQLSRMLDELIRIDREERTVLAELNRARGRTADDVPPIGKLPPLQQLTLDVDALRQLAARDRPQLAALRTSAARASKAIELARKDFYPDFDVRVSYGQRDNAPDGMRRSDMLSLTVAINLPVWRENKRLPKLDEANAMRDQALSQVQAFENELAAKLRQQVALFDQSTRSATLYLNDLRLQSTLSVEAAIIAYETNRGDFSSLLESQMTYYTVAINYASVLATQAKALAEIEYLIGRTAADPPEFLRLNGDRP